MGQRGNIYDSELLWLFNLGPEEVSEIKVAKMIDSPLHLNTLLRDFSCGNRHYSCVVDEEVNFVKRDWGAEWPDGLSIGKIQSNKFYFAVWMSIFALFDDSLCSFPVPGSNDNWAAKGSKIFDSFCTYSRIASSDDSIFASQINWLLMVLSTSKENL